MLTGLAYIFLGGLGCAWIFTKLKLPGFLGMLLAGILLGPMGWNLLDGLVLAVSGDLRRLALVIILARVGLSLDLSVLKTFGVAALLICFVPATLEIVGITLLAPYILGVTFLEAALIGTVAAGVSPAVIVPRMLWLTENGYGREKGLPQLLMAGASADNVYVIILFSALVKMIESGEGWSGASLGWIPPAIACGLGGGVAAGWGMAKWLGRFGRNDAVAVLVFLSLSFLFMALEQDGRVPFAGLLAIAVTGVVIQKLLPETARRLTVTFKGLWTGAEVLLFVLVGALIGVGGVSPAVGMIALLVAAGLGFRAAGVWLSLTGTRLDRRERRFCIWVYLPKATVQAAVGAIPLGMGLACGNTVLAVAVVSIVLTAPFGALMIDWTCKSLFKRID
jgi:NhaP-type Na+/H+ or K+/H+ antiporter